MVTSRFSDGFYHFDNIDGQFPDGSVISVEVHSDKATNILKVFESRAESGSIKIPEVTEFFVKKVILVGKYQISNQEYFLADLEMTEEELLGRFGRVRSRISDRDTCGYIALQYLRHKELTIYQKSSYLTVVFYSFLATESQYLLKQLENELYQTLAECRALAKSGVTHSSLYRDPRQMLLALTSVAWHYLAAIGEVENCRKLLKEIISECTDMDLRKPSLSLNYSFILFWNAVLNFSKSNIELFWPCIHYFQLVSNSLDINGDTPSGSILDVVRSGEVAYAAKSIIDDAQSLSRKKLTWVKKFNRVAQGMNKDQTISFEKILLGFIE